MGRKRILPMLIVFMLLITLLPGWGEAQSKQHVSNFEALAAALGDQDTTWIYIEDDIVIERDVLIEHRRAALTIDGGGHSLTFDGTIKVSDLSRAWSITIKDAEISGSAKVLEADEASAEHISLSLQNIAYSGGVLAALEGGVVKLDGGTYVYCDSVGSAMVAAEEIWLSGAISLSDEHAFYVSPILRAETLIDVSDDAQVEITMPGDAFSETSQEGRGLLGVSGDGKIELEQIASLLISYGGNDICDHEHDDVCGFNDPEGGICTHDCASEQYKCCRNVLFAAFDDFPATFAAIKDYPGEYQIKLEFLDGIKKQYDNLSAITSADLRGVKSLEITYIPPDTVNVRGSIVWNDEKNEYDTRPKSVRVALYRDGVITDRRMTVAKTEFTFSGEAYQDENGHVYDYTVRQMDDLSPTYKTTHNDKKNVITNKLVTKKVKVEYIDARTNESIAKHETHTVPDGYPLTIHAKDFVGYGLKGDQQTTIELSAVKKDQTHKFYYNEMLMFSGVHTFESSVGDALKYKQLTVNVYRNVWQSNEDEYIKDGGEAREQAEVDAQVALMEGFDLSNQNKLDSFIIDTRANPAAYQTPYQWRRYDDEGNPNIYTFAAQDESGLLYHVFTISPAGEINISVQAGEVTVELVTVVSEDPVASPGDAGQYQRQTKQYKGGSKLDVTFPETVSVNGREAIFAGIIYEAKNGTVIKVDGRRVTSRVLKGNVSVSVSYFFPVGEPVG